MSTFTVEDIVSEITSVGTLLSQRRRQLVDGVDAVESSMINQIKTMISQLITLRSADASTLLLAVAASALHEDLKGMITVAIDDRLQNQPALSVPRPGGGIQTQTLKNFPGYFTPAQLNQLGDRSISYQRKVSVVCELMRQLHMHNLTEATVRYAVAFLICMHCGEEWPGYQAVYNMVGDFKAYWNSLPKLGYMEVFQFPDDPKQLPALFFSRVWPGGQPQPVDHDVPRLNLVAEHVPMRNTSKYLRQNSGSNVGGNGHHSGGPQQSQQQQLMNAMTSFFATSAAVPARTAPGPKLSPLSSPRSSPPRYEDSQSTSRHDDSQSSSVCHGLSNTVNSGPSSSPNHSMLALENGSSSAAIPTRLGVNSGAASALQPHQSQQGLGLKSHQYQPAQGLQSHPSQNALGLQPDKSQCPAGDNTRTSEQFEDEAFRRLLAKSQSKKNRKSKAHDDAENEDEEDDVSDTNDEKPISKKPAASVMKKPASKKAKTTAATAGEADDDDEWKLMNMARNNYVSMKFHKARSLAAAKGSSKEDANAKGRKAYAAAATAWDKAHGKS